MAIGGGVAPGFLARAGYPSSGRFRRLHHGKAGCSGGMEHQPLRDANKTYPSTPPCAAPLIAGIV